jgi:hypothetical protein
MASLPTAMAATTRNPDVFIMLNRLATVKTQCSYLLTILYLGKLWTGYLMTLSTGNTSAYLLTLTY